ncbi:MAG: EamA family transporter [Pseudomonadota bacterium]
MNATLAQSTTGGMSARDLGFVLLMNIAWGSNFVTSKYAVTELPPIFTAGTRFLIVALVCLPWLKPLYGRMRPVLTLGFLMGCLHFALMFLALSMSKKVSGLAIIAQLGVPMAVLMAVVLLKERIGMWRIGGITMAFCGAVVLGFDPDIFQDLAAVSVMLGAVAVMSYCAILMRNLKGVAPLELQAWTGTISVLPLLGLSALVERDVYAMIPQASLVAWGAVVYSALVSSVIAHAINFYLLQRYPVSTVAPYSLIAPVIGVSLAIMVFGDAMTPQLIIGGLVTLGGVMIVTLRGAGKAAGG